MRRKMMLVVLMLGLLGVIAPVHHAAVTTAESRPVARYHEPTLLIHGYRAGPHAFDAFIRRAELTRRGRLTLTASSGSRGSATTAGAPWRTTSADSGRVYG
ncbi:hypothetical protein [Lacticaseibacillus nasuensis]|uniref:hypothetical protein n=1 Tax=Lacticaseibacillus nasuensis TaxID=944671 RepID=UPI0006D17A0B|nr:hypothetical protein [Lacticaseibacillus nasuensis]